MNVDALHDNPSLKWFFIAGIALLLVMLLGLLMMKLATKRIRDRPVEMYSRLV